MNRRERRKRERDPDWRNAQKIVKVLVESPPGQDADVPWCISCWDEEPPDDVPLFFCPQHFVRSGEEFLGWSTQEGVDRLNALIENGAKFAIPREPIPIINDKE